MLALPMWVNANTNIIGNSPNALVGDSPLIQKVEGNALSVNPNSPQYKTNTRNGLLLPNEVPASELLPSSGEINPPPYGANIFAGGYETERHDGLNEDYLIAAGDKLSIWLWGAISLAEVVTVDNQGNIFLPNVGPINVLNTKASQINNIVTERIRTIYKSNVNIYVNLLTSTPVSIFVSGAVIRPGQYAGIASDSILYYLKRAGGIDSERGSYRSIRILRKNQTVKQYDLYEFLQLGDLEKFNFKDGDTLFVDTQKPTISVFGTVRNPFRFELMTKQIKGGEVIRLVKPYTKVSHVGITGTRNNAPFSQYMDMKSFSRFTVMDGDQLVFKDDLRAQVLDVQLRGSYLGPSYYAVSKATRLKTLLSHIQVDPKLADIKSVYILRKSVAAKQKEMIEQSLQRLERNLFTQPVSSSGEAVIRSKETEMILVFTERARKIQPLGKVIVSDEGKVANILLEQGDVIVIPEKSDLIQVGGEVMMPQAIVFNPKADIDDYVSWAGGFSERANDKNPLIVKANGMIKSGRNTKLEAGDQILILPEIDNKTMQSVKDFTQIIYQIAVAANVIVK